MLISIIKNCKELIAHGGPPCI